MDTSSFVFNIIWIVRLEYFLIQLKNFKSFRNKKKQLNQYFESVKCKSSFRLFYGRQPEIFDRDGIPTYICVFQSSSSRFNYPWMWPIELNLSSELYSHGQHTGCHMWYMIWDNNRVLVGFEVLIRWFSMQYFICCCLSCGLLHFYGGVDCLFSNYNFECPYVILFLSIVNLLIVLKLVNVKTQSFCSQSILENFLRIIGLKVL